MTERRKVYSPLFETIRLQQKGNRERYHRDRLCNSKKLE